MLPISLKRKSSVPFETLIISISTYRNCVDAYHEPIPGKEKILLLLYIKVVQNRFRFQL